MMKQWSTLLLVVMLLLAAVPVYGQGDGSDEEPVITRSAPPNPDAAQLVEVASGLERPLYLTHAGDESGRLFILEQSGRIKIMLDDELLPAPFLDLTGIVTPLGGYSEQGLLGLAFHPEFAENGRFFVNYTDRNGTTVIAEYHVSADNPDLADPDSARILLTVEQPFANHNGGYIAFGPDGYLYISLGDGGSAGDPLVNGQNPWTLLGSILRLAVDAEGEVYIAPEDNPFAANGQGAPEIWAWGLRNVWRMSFDRATGDLYLADVGQNQYEEVNFQPAESTGGENYGWNRYEASQPYSGGDVPADMVLPIAEYDHSLGCSITGGYVYRGEAIPSYEAAYFYGDWCSGRIWTAYRDEAMNWQSGVYLDTDLMIGSFGEDEAGELYVLHYDLANGRIYRLEPVENTSTGG